MQMASGLEEEEEGRVRGGEWGQARAQLCSTAVKDKVGVGQFFHVPLSHHRAKLVRYVSNFGKYEHEILSSVAVL
jgi:hypothetical protein